MKTWLCLLEWAWGDSFLLLSLLSQHLPLPLTHSFILTLHQRDLSALSEIQFRLGLLQEAFLDPTISVHISRTIVITCLHVFSILDGRFPKGSFPVLCLRHLSQHLILSKMFSFVDKINLQRRADLFG